MQDRLIWLLSEYPVTLLILLFSGWGVALWQVCVAYLATRELKQAKDRLEYLTGGRTCNSSNVQTGTSSSQKIAP